MAGKEITDLAIASDFSAGDLMCLRKSGQIEDKAITYDNFVESIGNTAVDGFIAVADGENKIVINSVNGVEVNKYYTGMKISFVSPFKSTGQVQVKIGSLTYKNLLAYKSTSSVVIDKDDYIEAVLIGEAFYQVNNAQYIYTNDYKVVLIEPNTIAGYTDVFLETAYGVSKPAYYQGMTVNFLCTEDTSGLTRISVDGLPVKDMLESSGDYIDLIYTPLYKGQVVQLIFDGQSFIKNKFKTEDPKIKIPIEPDPEKPEQPIIPMQNQLAFTVGTIGNCNFSSLRQAVAALIKDYGKDGGGRTVTLTVMSDLATSTDSIVLSNGDYRWITLKGNNNVINITLDVYNGGFLTVAEGARCLQIAENTTINLTDPTQTIAGNGQCGFLYLSGEAYFRLVTFNSITPKPYQFNSWVQPQGNLYLSECTIKNGVRYIVLISQCAVVLIRCNLNSWSNSAVQCSGVNISVTIERSDLSKNGTSSTGDIVIASGTTVNQQHSRAKSNLAPNTNNNTGTYWVTGSQDVVGQ